jgi:methyl-accepting chemotaxis protein
MQQPENSNASRSLVFITLTALVVALAAGFAFFTGTAVGRFAALMAIVALVLLFLLFLSIRSSADEAVMARIAVETQRQESERNQGAILRLLDEIAGLGQGDLTATATVTEDITGAIADSVNIAVESLRGLVMTINQSSVQLDAATRQTQALAQHLAKSSSAQSRQIAAATESIGAMASSIEEVSGNAERAADVARHSVDIAHKGGEAVRRTIDGMNAIRETIQETSKRIKRLGESSQEIGNIVELINDLAEQTNILALNASIQASMAGEAGRGFAVVADEVQRLAERATNATKQIDALVRTIQADTNGAVVSMERSTADVVGGATLAENAGSALEKIECPTRSQVWCRTFPPAVAIRRSPRKALRGTCRCCARSPRRPPMPPATRRKLSRNWRSCPPRCASRWPVSVCPGPPVPPGCTPFQCLIRKWQPPAPFAVCRVM